MSGMLFQNPLGNFAQGRGWGWQMYYPSAYSTMQFMAYYGLNPAAGLYLASYDQSGNSKFFDFSKPSPSWAVAQMAHIPEFVAGADYQMAYPAVVGVFSGDWYEAAQLYRTWALEQPWTSQGPLATRSDVPDWYGSAGLRLWITTHPNCVSNSNPFSIIPEVVGDTGSYIGHPAIAGWMGWEHVGWYVEYPDVFPPKEGWDAFRQAITDTHASGNRVLFLPDTTSYSSAAPSWSSAEPYACRDQSGNYSNSFSFSECGMTATFHSMCPGTSLLAKHAAIHVVYARARGRGRHSARRLSCSWPSAVRGRRARTPERRRHMVARQLSGDIERFQGGGPANKPGPCVNVGGDG